MLLIDVLIKIYYKLKRRKLLKQFSSIGDDFTFNPKGSHFICENIHIGNHVSIGYNANFIASIAKIYIGDHVMFAPNVTIRGGDHRIDIMGRYIDTVTDEEKLPENDKDVVFVGDTWIGTNVTILKGVTIGRGAVIAAGALVINDVPAYAVFGGVPGKVLKYRFTKEQIIEHEQLLYGKVLTSVEAL
ncbi:acyltransferase [Zunongwangia sp.]|uniref:acyltransferase n=1 Tax=Zunongwangia sp. TaxID=1965325 RepID=UPI003AA8870A